MRKSVLIKFREIDLIWDVIAVLNRFWIVISKSIRKELKEKIKENDEAILCIDLENNTTTVNTIDEWHYSDETVLQKQDKYYYVYNKDKWCPTKKHLFIETAIYEAMRLSEKEKCEFEVLQKVWETKMGFKYLAN